MRKRERGRPLLQAAAKLQRLRIRHDALELENEMFKARKEVLESTIMYQDQVAAFKTAMQMHLQSEEPDPATDSELSSGRDSDVQLPDSTSYMISLINRAHPALVQQVLDWEATDWHNWLAGAAYQVCMLLQLTERGSQATGSAPAYVCTAEQDVNKAIDDIVTVGALGSIYVEAIGSSLGVCTALNHITMQQEAPPHGHWQRVLQQLQLSRAQLVKLTACYHEFTRQRKAHHALQENLIKAVASTSSCTQRLLAAAHAGSASAASAVGAATGDSTTQCGVMRGCAGAVDSSRSRSDGSPGADAAAEPADPTAPEALVTRLLIRVNQSFCMPFLVLHDTLTHKQIGRMLVASYPFIPRPAPLMEAACQHLNSINGADRAATNSINGSEGAEAAGQPAPAMQAEQQ